MSRSAVVVAIPAQDEEALVGACLAAIADLRVPPGVDVVPVVALDRCRDATARIVATHGVAAVAGEFGSVGAARAVAIEAGLRLADRDGSEVWIANTDADSRVDPAWVQVHLALAGRGASVVRGTVLPDPGDLDPELLSLFRAAHAAGDDHPYLYGANLGVAAEAYVALGGFRPLPAHEDRDLVDRAYAMGLSVVSTAQAPVVTSGRREGRARGGFADRLAELASRRD